jgi:hypothetical protein
MIKKVLVCISILALMTSMSIMPALADWEGDVINNLTKPALGGITGKWKFTMTPSIDIEDPTAVPSEWEVNLYDVDGAILGYAGLFHFQGTRGNNVVRLDVLSRSGQKTTLNLKITGADATGVSAMEGSLVSNDVDLGYKGLILKAARADTVPLKPGEEVLEGCASSWITKIISYIADKVIINELTWNSCHVTYDWMKAWDVHKNGAGYYMSGDHGPGSRCYATWTFYYPLDWGHAGDRTYSFYFHSGPANQTIDQLVFTLQGLGDSYPKCLGFSSNSALISAVKDFHNKYGDFAISTAYNDNTANADLYINLANEDYCSKAKQHTLSKTIWGQLSDHCDMLCGHDIHDTWHLCRSYVLVDGTALYITYVLGTISVWYD